MNSSIVDTPSLHPGKCIHCGGSTNRDGRKYLNTGIFARNYGQIYICSICIVELGHQFGLVSKAEVNKTTEDLLNTEMVLTAYKDENDRLRSALDLLDFLPQRSPGISHDEVAEQPIPDLAPEPERLGDESASGDASGSKTSKSGSDESDDGEGSPKLSSDDVRKLRSRRGLSV